MKNKDLPGTEGTPFVIKMSKDFLQVIECGVLIINGVEFRCSDPIKLNNLGLSCYADSILIDPETKTYSVIKHPNTAGWSDYK